MKTSMMIPALLFVFLPLFNIAFPATWTTETVDSTGQVGVCTSVATDASGNAHISYLDVTNDSLKYATNASGSWVTETVESVSTLWFGDTSLAVDSLGHAHITYYDSWYGNLKYATNTPGFWVTEVVDGAGDVGWYNAVALDGGSNVHVGYYDWTNGYLKYATNASGSWVKETVDKEWDSGSYCSIAIDLSGNAHVSYCAYKYQDLRYATNASGSWVYETVYDYGNAGTYTSIKTDSTNKVHISFRDAMMGELKYAGGVAGSWTIETVDDTNSSVGQYSSLGVDSSDKVHIGYYNGGDLKYATNVSGSWVYEFVDTAGKAGSFSSLAVGPSDQVHISYYDITNEDLKHARGVLSLPLVTDVSSISESTGGTVNFYLDAGPGNPNRNYLLLGGVTGTAPGTPLPGGLATLPLNWDLFTDIVFSLINTPMFSNFMAMLDGSGQAAAQMNIPPVPGAGGLVMYFAYALNGPWNFASNAVEITIVP